MKKFNTKTITEILNSRFAIGVGSIGYHVKKFTDDNTFVAIYDFDRGERHDYMTEKQIDLEYTKYNKKFKYVLDSIKLTLKAKKYSVVVTLAIDYKGFVSITIIENKISKITKMGVIESIRTAIFAERLTKVEILEILVASFPERDADKMAKTINAQLPSRIVKAGQEMDAKDNVKGIKTYKLFTK